jgi:hypothetical protein
MMNATEAPNQAAAWRLSSSVGKRTAGLHAWSPLRAGKDTVPQDRLDVSHCSPSPSVPCGSPASPSGVFRDDGEPGQFLRQDHRMSKMEDAQDLPGGGV